MEGSDNETAGTNTETSWCYYDGTRTGYQALPKVFWRTTFPPIIGNPVVAIDPVTLAELELTYEEGTLTVVNGLPIITEVSSNGQIKIDRDRREWLYLINL